MALTPGTRFGPYEIVTAIGAGGMGEVYRARDPKLNREVALKILPQEFATDPQTLATLNHPHIAHVHGFEDSAGARTKRRDHAVGLGGSESVPARPGVDRSPQSDAQRQKLRRRMGEK
jgi:hypothetical protein